MVRKLRVRFRVTTLLWLCAVISAFFVGQRSDEISQRLEMLARHGKAWLGYDVTGGKQIAYWPPGRVTFNSHSPINTASLSVDPEQATIEVVHNQKVVISPKADGHAFVQFKYAGAATLSTLVVESKDGKIGRTTLRY